MTARIALSYLYVPGDAGRRLDLAHTRGADAVIADLEDAVAADSKQQACREVASWLAQPRLPGPERWVRVNAGQQGVDDLEQVFGESLRGVCMPKVTGPHDVKRVAALLSDLERAHGWAHQPVSIMPLIETAKGLMSLSQTAQAPRVLRLQLGELDLAADLGLDPGPNEAELLPARSAAVAASVVADLLPPVGAVNPNVDDLAYLTQSTLRLRRLGFLGRAAVHPAQLRVIHSAFTPSEREVSDARRVLTAYDQAVAAGRGVWLDAEGRMIDEAVVRRSRRIVALTLDEEEQP